MSRNMSPKPVTLKVGDISLSGLRMGDKHADTLVIALHGGGYDANYWHVGDQYDGSLLRLGAGLGFDVLALDRPGYGASSGVSPGGFTLEQQADILFALLDSINDDRPVYLVGHSMGGILAVMMAADDRGARLSGIDVSGVPLHYPPDMRKQLALSLEGDAGSIGTSAPPSPERLREMFYGPDDSFDPALAALVDGKNVAPLAEVRNAANAPDVLPPLMRDVRVPVQWTIAEHERSSTGGKDMLNFVASNLPECPHLATFWQKQSGHNISIHHVGLAYHLRALAFFSECHTLLPEAV
ncbi:alpha/beta hydrolase [Novosphingobium cyanobacteriorum]|uniref:Alpha/beta hydrolase n=1 Tax=Novosphingobium cyanobacteriorum TaxID=3024215 RepID=A0ABT6CPF1_9SPHN|nr:alpha/beta hydrolase [Novosphingobium cyanobacteriorum]MDF8335757.1 alpha/beta hydrolase [Novosphingobium cyanobacteriorum]